MDGMSTCCSRSEFNQCATKLQDETAWELRTKQDAFGATFLWLEATYGIPAATSLADNLILVTVYAVYNPDFRVPQLGFFTSSLLSVDELRAALPTLSFLNAVLEMSSGVDAASTCPLVSCSWNDEVQRHMWLVHPCDTENLIRRSRYGGARGDPLVVFLRAMTSYFPLAPSLVPSA
ncbi:hypothetical protein ABB37_09230 [Leptomonas pyrrhocoris]|uniref:Uncharacterized protein n=1 Tax=Leptomonas pyrrhocoris TaxID=157538 RepID=A0A0N0VD91_LEPPY|nr:hypothetical protein ABB37_09230 [Leptomonas pyrrhocoris]KPA74608.1 hypothetical protein ABB37_09230 [Leptomonas pyrrhocoris]|eukprot:XP_015653047.1 hypothetical protein ABB37_09230 [Leptomonas pyrrhocoris]